MRIYLFALLISSSAAIAQAPSDCSWVIRSALQTTTVVQNSSAFEAQAADFCKEFQSAKGSSSSTSVGVSYAGIGASFGQSGGSAESLASKLCQSSDQSKSRADAYRQYVETVAPGAFESYNRCVALQGNGVNVSIAREAVLPKYFAASISFLSAIATSSQEIAFSASPGVTCSWSGTTGKTIKLIADTQTSLQCKRVSDAEPSTVMIFPRTTPQSALDFRWTAYKKAKPVDEMVRLNTEIQAAGSKLAEARNSFRGSVLAFASTACPVGWIEYTQAQGRFIRGLSRASNPADGDPDPVRAPGAYQADLLASHTHTMPSSVIHNVENFSQSNAPALSGPALPFAYVPRNTEAAGGAETRPRNIALLYCSPGPNF